MRIVTPIPFPAYPFAQEPIPGAEKIAARLRFRLTMTP